MDLAALYVEEIERSLPKASEVEWQFQVEFGERQGRGTGHHFPLVELQRPPRPRPRDADRVPLSRPHALRGRQVGEAAAQVEPQLHAAPADEVQAEKVPVAVGVLPVVQDDSGVGLVGEEPHDDVELPGEVIQ